MWDFLSTGQDSNLIQRSNVWREPAVNTEGLPVNNLRLRQPSYVTGRTKLTAARFI